MNNSEAIQIIKKLISLPSFVDKKNNEAGLAAWIYDFLRKNSNLKVKKEYFLKERFNVLAYNSLKPNILIVGHMDTVQPKYGWKTNPFAPKIIGNKIFGLGTSDMKGGIAVLLSAITKAKKIDQKIMFLFYGDEEYDFLGMKKFVNDYKNKIRPKIIISADGESNKLGSACRGLIELTMKVSGKSGHSANPKKGINAITGSFKVIRNLGKEGNIIPDYAEFVIEIRVADPKLNASLVKNFIKRELEENGQKIMETIIRHDLGSWITPENEVVRILGKQNKKTFTNAKKRGYVDAQMLWEAFNKTTTLTAGAGTKGVAHRENEFVEVKNLKELEKFYLNIIVNKLA